MKIGSLFSGYGGLDMGVQSVLGGETVWHVEIEEAPSKVLAHRWDVPNYGDIRTVPWEQVEPIDILTGGFPCQDVSLAGRRAGITDGSRSGLWSEFAHAIDVLRPKLVVIENVRGLLSASADGPVESDPWGVGDGAAGSVVNAFGVVLGDLASLGYDARWGGFRASDAGAPHGRFRVFVVAYPAGERFGHRGTAGFERVPAAAVSGDLRAAPDAPGDAGRVIDGDGAAAQDADIAARGERRVAASGEAEGGRSRSDAGRRGRAPVPDTESERWREGRPEPEGFQGGSDDLIRRSSAIADDRGAASVEWGAYEPAIRRWEHVLGRVAPEPTNPDGKRGAHRLAPEFVEWMMGAPEGHVTSPALGITRAQQLRMLGNGVVVQQSALAVRTLLEVS